MELKVSSTVAGGGGANKGHGSTAAKQRQLMEGRTSGGARKVQKSDERWPALWPSWDADAPELKKAHGGIAAEGSATDLTRPGHPVIVEAIDLPRKILQRMENYVFHCAVCTLQLLVFIFLATLLVDPETGFWDKSVVQDDDRNIPRYFALPGMAMTVVCSFAGFACGGSMLVLYMCLAPIEFDSFLAKYSNVENLTYRQIQCALEGSMSDFLPVLAARTHGFFFTSRPGFSPWLRCSFRNEHVHASLLVMTLPCHGTCSRSSHWHHLVHHPGRRLRGCEPYQILIRWRVSGNEGQEEEVGSAGVSQSAEGICEVGKRQSGK